MVFSIHTHTNFLGHQIIPIDVWEEGDVAEWGAKQKMKSHILFSFKMHMWPFSNIAIERGGGRPWVLLLHCALGLLDQ